MIKANPKLEYKWKKTPQREKKDSCNLKKFLSYFWPGCKACGILVPRPGIAPAPPAVEAWSLNHWTAREVPDSRNFFLFT